MGKDSAESLLEANPKYFENRPDIKRICYEYFARNEIAQTKELLAKNISEAASFARVANPISLLVYDRSIDMFDHVNFRNCRRMVMVGCGWMPAILFHIHDKTDVPELIGLDTNPDAIETARKMAVHLGYDRVKAEVGDGCSYDYREAQIVYIVGMVSELKSAVLSRIANTAPDTVQVVLNEPHSFGHLWEEAIEPSLDRRFKITGRGAVRKNPQRDLYLTRR